MKRNPKQKPLWSREPKAANPDLELCKVMQTFQNSLDYHDKAGEVAITFDMHYCMSLAEKMSALDKRTKVFVRLQSEKIFFDLEFASCMFPKDIHFQGPQSHSDHQIIQQHHFGRRSTSTPQHFSRQLEDNDELNTNHYTTLS